MNGASGDVAGKILLSRSGDRGKTWSDPVQVNSVDMTAYPDSVDDFQGTVAVNVHDTADHHPLTGRAAFVYEVLIAEEDIWGEEHRA